MYCVWLGNIVVARNERARHKGWGGRFTLPCHVPVLDPRAVQGRLCPFPFPFPCSFPCSFPCRAVPYPSVPFRAFPCFSVPHPSVPCRAMPCAPAAGSSGRLAAMGRVMLLRVPPFLLPPKEFSVVAILVAWLRFDVVGVVVRCLARRLRGLSTWTVGYVVL